MRSRPAYLEKLLQQGAIAPLRSAFDDLYMSLWSQPHLPVETLELCRLRILQLHRCDEAPGEQGAPIDDAQRNALSCWQSSAAFSTGQKACLAFTEVYVMDCAAITDEQAAAVKDYAGDAGLMLLIEALGVLDAMVRLSLVWRLAPVDAGLSA